jgi:Family of unknown function (DUF5343)
MTEQTVPPPPYFAFKTLTNMIVKMEEHGPPPRIDRTFLTGMSGAGQTQFIAGLKSLGLIDEDGVVQPNLVELVNKPDERPTLIGQLLRERYPEAIELGSGNATTGQLVEVFNGYGVQGDTARKAIAFYLQAAKYAGDIPLSPHFKTPTVKAQGGGSKKRPKKAAPPAETPSTPVDNGIPSGLHPALAGLLATIPKQGQTWTQEEHDRFKAAFDPVLAIAAPVSDDETSDPDEEEGDWD